MKKKNIIHEEPGKLIYSTTESDQLIQEFNDGAVFGNKKVTIKGKGAINNQISTFLFEYLSGFNIPTHFLKKISAQEMLVRNLEMIPVEVVLHNIADGSFSERFGIEKGKELSSPVLEFYYKDNSGNHPMMNSTHIVAFEIAAVDELKIIERVASKVNAVLKSFFVRRQIKLVDFKLEFGRYKNKIMLGAGISLDSCRLLPISTEANSDNNKLQFEPGDGYEKYEQVRNQILK